MTDAIDNTPLNTLRRRASVVCVHEGQLLVYRAVDPTSGRAFHFLPGGQIEAGESPAACARRETREETGYDVDVTDEPALLKRYTFFWDGRSHLCETWFLLGTLLTDKDAPESVHDADFNQGVVWLPLSEVEEQFRYHADIGEAVRELLFSTRPAPASPTQ